MQKLFEKSNAISIRFITFLSVAALFVMAASTVAAGTDQPDPYAKTNEAWITLNGTVGTVAADTFTLDYGEGVIMVEMDDGDRDADAYKLLKGDKVTVTGKIDADLFESTTIEAASVYVENMGTTFFASSTDEEDAAVIVAEVTVPFSISRVTIQGQVAEVNGDDFIIDTGDSQIRVDVSSMPYDPLDDEGYPRIDVGDHVKVVGVPDIDLFEGREIEAQSLIKLFGYAS